MSKFGSGLQLGIEEIDDQHQGMVALLRHIAVEIESHHQDSNGTQTKIGGEPLSAHCQHIRSLIDQLVELTTEHFRTEERLMRDTDYPGYAEHKYEHKMLMVELRVFVRSVFSGKECIDAQDLVSLRRWLVGHIALEDRQMASYLLSRTVTQQTTASGQFSRMQA
jgi:hemerythrin